MSEGGTLSYSELPEDEQNALVAWVRDEKERQLLRDPWIFVKLKNPDGTDAESFVHQMRTSCATRLNQQREFAFLRAQRDREAKLARYDAAIKAEARSATEQNKAARRDAEEFARATIPGASEELLAYRKAHPPVIKAVQPRAVAKPDTSWGPDDALWYVVEHSGVGEPIKHYDDV